jgi:sulfoxide reductase heme-binding subunit YedZ
MKSYFRPPLKPIIFLICLWPLFSISYKIYIDNLGANPIEYIEKHFGLWALIFLCLTLSLTPLKQITHIGKWVLYRRMLGLFVFFYASIHLLMYLGLDYQFAWSDIKDDIVKHKYVLVGFLAWLLLIPLAVTSSNKMIKRLKRRWKSLHQLIYVVAILAVLHFVWLVKKDITEPIIYGSVLGSLLLIRVYFYYKKRSQSRTKENK